MTRVFCTVRQGPCLLHIFREGGEMSVRDVSDPLTKYSQRGVRTSPTHGVYFRQSVGIGGMRLYDSEIIHTGQTLEFLLLREILLDFRVKQNPRFWVSRGSY